MFTIEKVSFIGGKPKVATITEGEFLNDLGAAARELFDGFFRLVDPSTAELWNEFIRAEWAGLDDCDYYTHDEPYICDGGWYAYMSGSVLPLDDFGLAVAEHLANYWHFLDLLNEKDKKPITAYHYEGEE